VAAAYSRIMIEPVGNIYYAVSKNIGIGYTITETTTCTPFTATPNSVISGATTTGFIGYGLNIPNNIAFDKMTVSVNITHSKPNDLRIGIAVPGSSTVNAFFYDRSCPSISPANIITTFEDAVPALDCAGINAGNSHHAIDAL